DGVEVDRDLAAEPTADLHRHNPDFRHGQLEYLGHLGPDTERTLRARPDGDRAVAVPVGGRRVGLDVALVHHLGGVFTFDHVVGFGEGGLDVAVGEPDVLGDVRRLVAGFAGDGLRPPRLAQDGRVGPHGVAYIEHRREDLVFDADLCERFFGHVAVDCGDGGDRVALIERLVGREDVVAQFLQVDGAFAQLLDLVGRAGQVLRRNDSEDARVPLRFARVDRKDAGVRVRAAEDARMDKPRQADVGAVLRLAGDLLHAVGADWAGADDFEWAGFDGGH